MDERMDIARAAAAAALINGPDVDVMFVDDADRWPLIGRQIAVPEGAGPDWETDAYDAEAGDAVEHLAAFVRDFPTAPLEALYRHARSHGVHGRDSDGWDDVPAAFRIAYAVFRATLIEADRVFAEEEARAAAKAAADKAQAPVMVRASETILEQHGTIFEKVGDPDPMVNLGGPVVAASEGEGGDGSTVGVAGPDASPPDGDPGTPLVERAGMDSAVLPASAAVAGEASSPEPTPEAPEGGQSSADALEAEAKAVTPARKKR